MQFTSLSKTAHTIGLMFLLSVMVGTSMQQSAQAQNKAPTQPATACAPLPQGKIFNEFEGMTFSRQQDRVFRRIAAARNKRFQTLSKTFRSVPGSSDLVNVAFKDGVGIEKANEINNALDALQRDKVPGPQIVELMNKRYGRYSITSISQVLVPFTPEQIATGQKIWRDFEAQTMAILTPGQRKIYREKLATLRGIEACQEPNPYSQRIGSFYTTVDGRRVGVDGGEMGRTVKLK